MRDLYSHVARLVNRTVADIKLRAANTGKAKRVQVGHRCDCFGLSGAQRRVLTVVLYREGTMFAV